MIIYPMVIEMFLANLTLAFLFTINQEIRMCTSIKLKNKNSIVLAQNYDFYYGHGLIIVNKRNIYKAALSDNTTKENMFTEGNSGVKWKSKYGSVTFNQFGRELPNCGINEAGLSIASMWHDTDQRPETESNNNIVTELQWIQMQLDKHSSINEVEKDINNYTYSVSMYPMHYHIVDRSGESAIVELVDGRVKILRDIEIPACSNAGYQNSLSYSKKYLRTKPDNIKIIEPILDRASKAMLLSNEFNNKETSEDIYLKAFQILDLVSLKIGFKDIFRWIGKGIPPSQTILQIAFDITNRRLLFRSTNKKYYGTKELSLNGLDFTQTTPVMIYNIEQPGWGSVDDNLNIYSEDANRKIVKKSFAPVKKDFPVEEQEDLIKYPELLTRKEIFI